MENSSNNDDLSPRVISAGMRIFESFCGGKVDWSKHIISDKDDNIFSSFDWQQALAYAQAALDEKTVEKEVLAERERCAKIAEESGFFYAVTDVKFGLTVPKWMGDNGHEIAEKIRNSK